MAKSESIELMTQSGIVFNGSQNGDGKLQWRYQGKKVSAVYVSLDNLNALKELYVVSRDTASDKSSPEYRKKLDKLIEYGSDEYSGDKGFLVQLVKKEGSYDLVRHIVSKKGAEFSEPVIRPEDEISLSDTPRGAFALEALGISNDTPGPSPKPQDKYKGFDLAKEAGLKPSEPKSKLKTA